MRRHVFQVWLAAVLVGCGSLRPPYPEDPLLIGRKPIIGKAENSESVRVASNDPAPPPVDPDALAQLPHLPGGPATDGRAARRDVPATPASRPTEPSKATPAVRYRERGVDVPPPVQDLRDKS